MKKLILIAIIVLIALSCLTFVACSEGDGADVLSGVFYSVEGDELNESYWLRFVDGEWTDALGRSGKYQVEDGILILEFEEEDFLSGVVRDDEIEFRGEDVSWLYRKKTSETNGSIGENVSDGTSGDEGDGDPAQPSDLSDGDPEEDDDSFESDPCAEGEHTLDGNCVCVKCGVVDHSLDGCICERCGAQVHDFNLHCYCRKCKKTIHGVKNGGYCIHFDDDDDLGDEVYFGSYPMSLVDDDSITTALSRMAGTLPTKNNDYKWTDYNYYNSTSGYGDYMWYIDLSYNGGKYRGVYFITYRAPTTTEANGWKWKDEYNISYECSTTYWFKYEPLHWYHNASKGDSYVELICDTIVDSQPFLDKKNYKSGKSENNYEYSFIRSWLNESFYNTAFDELQKAHILTTVVSNGLQSALVYRGRFSDNGKNTYICNDTDDKVYLLSAEDVEAEKFGAVQQSTAYAQTQGRGYGVGTYWLRTPYYGSGNEAYTCDYLNREAEVQGKCSVYRTYMGVLPCLRIQLEVSSENIPNNNSGTGGNGNASGNGGTSSGSSAVSSSRQKWESDDVLKNVPYPDNVGTGATIVENEGGMFKNATLDETKRYVSVLKSKGASSKIILDEDYGYSSECTYKGYTVTIAWNNVNNTMSVIVS